MYLFSKCGQIAFQTLMFALKPLDSGEVRTVVRGVKCVVLLLDPVLGLIGIAVVALHLVGRAQSLCTFGSDLL